MTEEQYTDPDLDQHLDKKADSEENPTNEAGSQSEQEAFSETQQSAEGEVLVPQRKRLPKEKKDKIFSQEFVPQMDALYNFGYHLTYNEADANDLVQETLLKAYRFIDSYQEGTNAKAWLFRILKNAFINDYRKKSKRPTQIDYEEIVNYQDAEDHSFVQFVDLREEVFQGMIGDEVTNALNSLPVDFRTVVLLCDVEGFTYEEIAVITDIPIGTVRSRLHRARNMLKDKLQEYAKEMGLRKKR